MFSGDDISEWLSFWRIRDNFDEEDIARQRQRTLEAFTQPAGEMTSILHKPTTTLFNEPHGHRHLLDFFPASLSAPAQPLAQTNIDLYDYTSFLQDYSSDVFYQLAIEHDIDSNESIPDDMSSHSNFVSKSYSSSTFTSSSNGNTQTWSASESRSSNPQGTTIERSTQEPGQQPLNERIQLDSQGKPMLDRPQQESGRIEDVSEADKQYMERMEDEYAKREGGA